MPGLLAKKHEELLERARTLAAQIRSRQLVRPPTSVRIVGVEMEVMIAPVSPDVDPIRVYFSLQRHQKERLMGYPNPDAAKADVQDLNTVIYCSQQYTETSFLGYCEALAEEINKSGAKGRTFDATRFTSGHPLRFSADMATRVPLNRDVHVHPVATPGYAVTLARDVFTDFSRAVHGWFARAENRVSAITCLNAWDRIRNNPDVLTILLKSETFDIDRLLRADAERFK